MANKKVYGARICKVCGGICHENSIRDKHGMRKSYYCSRTHLAHKFNESLDQHMRKLGYYEGYSYTDEEIDELIDRTYEYVDVITS